MPVPIPGSKVGSDNQKVKFLTISGRPKTGIFGQISGVPGPFPQFPLATNHADPERRACVTREHPKGGQRGAQSTPELRGW